MRTARTILALAVAATLALLVVAVAQQSDAVPSDQAKGDPDLGFTDTPIIPGQIYRVHDLHRPKPPKVVSAALPGGPPSDAIVLFDGSDLSQWTYERRVSAESKKKDPRPLPPIGWKLENGYLEVIARAGTLVSKEKFGDVQLHVEWSLPVDVPGKGQNRGNSGILLMRRYEIQLLDSYDNITYADGQAGAIYGQWAPLVNPARKPGEWQWFDIVFEAPAFDGDKLAKPAYITVLLNGVLQHHRQEILGTGVYRRLAQYQPHPAEDSLVLQNHNEPVRFRNIWVRRLNGYDQPER